MSISKVVLCGKPFQMHTLFLVKAHNALQELYYVLQRVVGTQD